MTGRISAEMHRVMELIRCGVSPYAAAKQVGVALSTVYRSALYKSWRDHK